MWDVTLSCGRYKLNMKISTHTSRVGCDKSCPFLITKATISTHTSRVGCDSGSGSSGSGFGGFLLTHPVWDVT